MAQGAETNWKWIENEHLPITLYLNHFKESKLKFGKR